MQQQKCFLPNKGISWKGTVYLNPPVYTLNTLWLNQESSAFADTCVFECNYFNWLI